MEKGATVTPQTAGRPVEILLVEDNVLDATLTVEALDGGKVPPNITVVEDGEQALAVLRRLGQYANAVSPDIILLDLGLPKKNGQQVLAEIKADRQLRHIPVVILTTSDAAGDILQAYDLHANCYLTKPTDPDQFTALVQSIEEFWLSTVRLPPRE